MSLKIQKKDDSKKISLKFVIACFLGLLLLLSLVARFIKIY